MSRQAALWVCLHCVWFLHQAESNSFVKSPDVVRGDVTGSATLEWTLQSEPGRDDFVGFTFNGADVFRYIPYTGVIPWRVIEGPGGNEQKINATYDARFTIYNTSTSGVGFRVAVLRPEDAGTYTCSYESMGPKITMSAVLFVYDVPGRPVIEANPGTLVDGVTTVSLECRASSTSLPVAYRPAMLYTWSRNGVDIDRTASPERHAVLGDRRQFLAISPIHHTDTTYTCTASESGTHLTSEEFELPLNILHGPYNLTTNPQKPSARENDSLEITASADCNPACNFTWSIGDDVISHGPVLKFDNFQLLNANNYTLRAETIHIEADLTVEVILDTSVGEYTVPVGSKVWTTDGVTVDVTLYSSPAPSKFGDNFIVIVVSAAAGGLVLLIIIIVVAVCCARRRRKKKDDASVEDLVLDGSTTANGTRGFANGDVEAPPPAIYAQVNKAKKGRKDNTEKEDEANEGAEPVLYAQVDKNRPRKAKDIAKENGQREVSDELTVPVPLHYDDVEGASAPHPDHVTSVAEDPYTDIASASHVYNNTAQGQGQPIRSPKKVQGFTYGELTFAEDSDPRPEVIHSKEPPTEYSQVDFNRTAPPSN